jgi:hypothetical protein
MVSQLPTDRVLEYESLNKPEPREQQQSHALKTHLRLCQNNVAWVSDSI